MIEAPCLEINKGHFRNITSDLFVKHQLMLCYMTLTGNCHHRDSFHRILYSLSYRIISPITHLPLSSLHVLENNTHVSKIVTLRISVFIQG